VGVPIVAGGDVGVFTHGNNVIELEMMVDYGMPIGDVLKAATSGNAALLELELKGRLQKDFFADVIAVRGNPLANISDLRNVLLVIKNGERIK
jgi:imidazolonepropionase-like amidohydrolase